MSIIHHSNDESRKESKGVQQSKEPFALSNVGWGLHMFLSYC